MPIPSAARRAAVIVALALCASLLAADGDADLPEGFVRGDVVSYSYVPIHTYRPDEAIGVLPYLWEYYLMKWDGKHPLTHHHAENLRRIDIASQWSTAIMLYARYDEWHDELINLMLRCYRNRQLIIMADYWPGKDVEPGAPPYQNLAHILTTLWEGRGREFVSPEGDRATGLQLSTTSSPASVAMRERPASALRALPVSTPSSISRSASASSTVSAPSPTSRHGTT